MSDAVRRRELLDALPELRGRRIAVVGDLLLDEYIYGTARRLSREAMLPVFEPTRSETQPGGGAFSPLAVRALGSEAVMIGCVGDDPVAATLLGHLTRAGIDTSGVVTARKRVTACKTRYMAEGFFRFPQQVFRVDHLPREPLSPFVREQIAASVRAVGDVDAILVSDYRQGAVDGPVVDAVREAATRTGALTTVDSQRSLDPYHGFTLVRNNRAEAERHLGRALPTVADVLGVLPQMRDQLGATNVCVSLGEDGLAVLGADGRSMHIPQEPVDVFDVTGAGDTLIVAMTLGLAAGLPLEMAARLGNFAAGVAVRRLGNVTVSLADVEEAIREADDEYLAAPDGGR